MCLHYLSPLLFVDKPTLFQLSCICIIVKTEKIIYYLEIDTKHCSSRLIYLRDVCLTGALE
jgi:hypothetical protein